MKPLEMAVNALSSCNAVFLVAEGVVEFVLKKLDGSMSDTGVKVKYCLKRRTQKRRRTDLIRLIEYLKKYRFLLKRMIILNAV